MQAAESLWRHRIVYPVLKKILRNPEMNKPIDIHSIQRLLILRNDRIGDMIVTTPVLRDLKKANPQLFIGVFASEKNVEIIRHNSNVALIHIAYRNWIKLFREIMKARRQKYDVVLNFIFNRMTSSGLLANIIAPRGIKIGQGTGKYKFYFNMLLSLKRYEIHMAELLSSFVRRIFENLEKKRNPVFEIIIDERTTNEVNRFLRVNRLTRRAQSGRKGSPYLVFNLSAPDLARKLSRDQVYALGRSVSSQRAFRTVVITAPADREMDLLAALLCSEMNCIRFPEEGSAPLLHIASLVEGAFCVLTPHTSIIHFASATKTPVIGCYGDSAQDTEWLPYKVKHRIVKSTMNRHVSTIPIPYLLRSVNEFIRELKP